jgi:hypothetical protein
MPLSPRAERRPGRQRTPATAKVPRVPLQRINASVTSVLDAVFWSKQQARAKRGWEARAAKMREQLRKHMQTHEDWLNPRKVRWLGAFGVARTA